jgi:hypothetical protein
MLPKRLGSTHDEIPLLQRTKEDSTFDAAELEPELNGRGLGSLRP